MTTQPAEGLPELPAIQRYTVVGDIAYPIHEDPEGSVVGYDDHVAAMHAYAREAIATAVPAEECEHNWRRGYGEPPYCSKCGAKEEAASVPVEKLREFISSRREIAIHAEEYEVLSELESLIQQEPTHG